MKVKITLCLVLCCLLAISSWAARKVEFTQGNAYGYLTKLNSQSVEKALGLEQGEKFTVVRQITDMNGVSHSRYQQTFNGFPVWGMQTVVSRDLSGKAVRLHGTVIQGTAKDILAIPKVLDPKGALKKMQDQHKAKDLAAQWSFRNEQAGTYVYIDAKGKANLCYMVSFFADTECGNPSRPLFFIDVKSGRVIHSIDSLAYAYEGTGPGGNLKIGQYTYGSTYPAFGVTVGGSTCTMNYADCKTVDLNHGTSGTTAYSYTCYNNTHENINGGYCPLNDGQFFGQQIYNMYQAWYGVPVLPFQLMMRVHYSTNYENAFWDGSSMTFGDGYTTFYPLVALDVSAHEVSHGFTENNSGLIYSSQSGGINESYSDMAGEAAKYYMRGTNDFMCGYDIYKAAGKALRYLCNPPLDGRSIDHVSEYYEGLDVHYSSGIFNKAFCLIAQSTGWTTRMAFDIFTKANQVYWIPGSTFVQGAQGALDAAMDYNYPCQDVVDAFAVVGITLTCPGPSVDMYVSNISQVITKVNRKYKSTATVTIKDVNNALVPNATVFITWSGVVSGSASAVTGSNGNATFTSSQVNKTGPFTITVTNVTHASNTYNPALNIETSDTASY